MALAAFGAAHSYMWRLSTVHILGIVTGPYARLRRCGNAWVAWGTRRSHDLVDPKSVF
jgi:hypothetical protein